MNINTNKIYISWLRRQQHFAFRLEHGFQGSCRVLEMASSTLSKEWIGSSSRSFSCQCLWSGISHAANVLRIRMLEHKHIEEAWSAEQGYFLPSEIKHFHAVLSSQAFLCCALEGWVPLGVPWDARSLCPLALAILAHPHLSDLKYKLFRASTWSFMCFERAVYN